MEVKLEFHFPTISSYVTTLLNPKCFHTLHYTEVTWKSYPPTQQHPLLPIKLQIGPREMRKNEKGIKY